MRKHIVEPDRPKMNIRHMHFAVWVHKAVNTHSVYVIRIGLSRQRKLRKGAKMLRLHDYVRCLACFLAVFGDLIVTMKA
jgi:hypothetical protein